MKYILLLVVILIVLYCILYCFNPHFDNTPEEKEMTILIGAPMKGAWGAYHEVVFKEGNFLIERTGSGEQILQKFKSYTDRALDVNPRFKLKITSRCDIRHGCFMVILDILEDTTDSHSDTP